MNAAPAGVVQLAEIEGASGRHSLLSCLQGKKDDACVPLCHVGQEGLEGQWSWNRTGENIA